MTDLSPIERRRAGWFCLLVLLVSVVADGYSNKPSPFLHQLVLIPFTVVFLYLAGRLLFEESSDGGWWTPSRGLWFAVGLEVLFFAVLAYEFRHFASLGYQFRPALTAGVMLPALGLLVVAALKRPLSWGLAAVAGAGAYLAGMIVALASFPLTYLRSDMLPVILWADTNLLHGISPYKTMYVADRVYDFPYLPGMMLAYVPAVWAHLDVRLGAAAYLLGLAAVALWAARAERRVAVASLVVVLLVCPFLQYRHELYISPHWFWMVLSLVLMARRRFGWAAAAFGFSMAIYQFSWVIFPFFVLNAFWRKGWGEAVKVSAVAVAAFLVMDGAFLASAYQRVASNTVGQWNLLPRAMAEPINLSYWITYLVAPAHLQRLQAVLMVGIFGWCVWRRRCSTVADSVRWMVVALGLFIMTNVIIDGYFYLTWLVLGLAYVCVANGWWARPDFES